jgi:Interferon-induced transmembrane protein
MFCRQCGQQNDENTYRCVNCGYLLHSAPVPIVAGEFVQNYLVFAIFSVAFAALCSACYCLPIGLPFAIPAVICSAQVNGRVSAGDFPGAREASKKAQRWCWISVGVSLAGVAVYLVFMAVMIAIGATAKH